MNECKKVKPRGVSGKTLPTISYQPLRQKAQAAFSPTIAQKLS